MLHVKVHHNSTLAAICISLGIEQIVSPSQNKTVAVQLDFEMVRFFRPEWSFITESVIFTTELE